MLPVQTVMIRYMVLVYRWGRGWPDAAGARGGFVGGAVRGGCARRSNSRRARKGDAKAPPTRGRRGTCPDENNSAIIACIDIMQLFISRSKRNF